MKVTRLQFLSGILLASGITLSIWTFVINGKGSPPSTSASFEVQRKYWSKILRDDPSDVNAYITFGTLEEREGQYISARRHLLAARSLGASDTKVSAVLGRIYSHLALESLAQVELEKAFGLAPDNVDSVLNLAGFHVDARRTGTARNLLNSWVDTHETYTYAAGLERIIMAFISCGDEKSADKLAKRLLVSAPNDPGALSLAARTAMDVGDAQRAKIYLAKLLPIAPDPAGAQFLYGLILNRLKDYDGALAAWRTANTLNPAAPDVYERIGKEYARRGDFKKAAFALDKVASVDQGYVAAFRAARASEKAGNVDDAAYWDATALGLRGEFERALVIARRATQTKDPSKKRRALVAVAEAYRGLKKTADYVRTIEDATREGTVDDLLLRAYAYYQAETKESLPKRLVCLRKAAELAPDRRAAISLEVAEQLRRTGNRDAAELEMEEALKVAPDDAQLLRTLGSFYMDRADNPERIKKAVAASEKAVKLAPLDEQAWLQLGQCYLTINQPMKSIQCLEHVIDLEPGYGPGYLELARVYAKLGDKESNQEMMRLYTKYVSFEQKHDTLQTRARGPKAKSSDIQAFADFLLNAGDLIQAVNEYERILTRNGDDKRARTILKQLYARLGNTEELIALQGSK